MNRQQNELDMGFTHERFPEGIHVCLIYDQDEERKKIVSEYLAAGLRRGEQIRYLTDTTSPDIIRSWLAELGVEVPEAVEKGQLNISPAESVYCTEGRFDPRKYIDAMPPRFERSKNAGYPGMRTSGEMSWSLRGLPGSERLLEYEVLLNTVHTPFPFSGMCQYDARLFDGATLFNVLKVHPWMVVRGKVVQNPYYISPQEFLKEYPSNP